MATAPLRAAVAPDDSPLLGPRRGRAALAAGAAEPARGAGAALVIDSASMARQAVAYTLRELGFGTVSQASRLEEARRLLGAREYELVVCDYRFEGQPQSGAEMLDELRRDGLLPLATVVVMVTGEAHYATVADAAESAVDCYLLKPHTAAELARRVLRARQRKRALAPLIEAIEAGDFDIAAERADLLVRGRGRHWVHAARLGAEVMLRLGRVDEATALFEAVVATQAMPWARLGIARAHLADRRLDAAGATLESLLTDHAAYVDAYDVMGLLHVERGRLDRALACYRQAATLVPGSLPRLHKQGLLAFMQGELDEAAQALGRAASLGAGSPALDPQTLMLLAILHLRQADAAGIDRCEAALQAALRRQPEDRRLSRLTRYASALQWLQRRRPERAEALLDGVVAECMDEDFDYEAAVNLVGVLAAAGAAEQPLDDARRWVQPVARRFATSKASMDSLVAAAHDDAALVELVRQAYTELGARTEAAMGHALAGDRTRSVRELLALAEETANTRLIDSARQALRRYHDAIDELGVVEELAERIRRLVQRYDRRAVPAEAKQAPATGAGPQAAIDLGR